LGEWDPFGAPQTRLPQPGEYRKPRYLRATRPTTPPSIRKPPDMNPNQLMICARRPHFGDGKVMHATPLDPAPTPISSWGAGQKMATGQRYHPAPRPQTAPPNTPRDHCAAPAAPTRAHRTAPSAPPHRQAPTVVRSHLIGEHLIKPSRPEQALEERAMRRALEMEAQVRLLEKRLRDATLDVPRMEAALDAKDATIAALQEEVLTLRHALAVSQSRVWQPGPPAPLQLEAARIPAPDMAAVADHGQLELLEAGGHAHSHSAPNTTRAPDALPTAFCEDRAADAARGLD
jgi:hypothetical protein